MLGRRALPILMYHQVTPHPHPRFRTYAVTPRQFAAQMAWLSAAGYDAITMDTLVRQRRSAVPSPPRQVVITFDDGYEDCVTYAVPVLRALGLTAVFYLVSGLIGQLSAWLLSERGIQFSLLDWAAARELDAAGFQIGSHSVSHPRLAQLAESACREQLVMSRGELEDQLGHEVRHLAYPHGSYDGRVRALAIESGYESACSVRIGLSPADDDPFALHRVPVTGQDSLLDFVSRLHTAGVPRDIPAKGRRVLRRLSRALAGAR